MSPDCAQYPIERYRWYHYIGGAVSNTYFTTELMVKYTVGGAIAMLPLG